MNRGAVGERECSLLCSSCGTTLSPAGASTINAAFFGLLQRAPLRHCLNLVKTILNTYCSTHLFTCALAKSRLMFSSRSHTMHL